MSDFEALLQEMHKDPELRQMWEAYKSPVKVTYNGEVCSRKDFTALEPGLCYHCDKSIPVGSEISLLSSPDGDIYRMHKACADSV